MKTTSVRVIFDRKKKAEKTGKGKVELVVSIDRKSHKYITVCSATPKTWPTVRESSEVQDKKEECEELLRSLEVLNGTVTLESFNAAYEEKTKDNANKRRKNEFNGYDQNSSFIGFMKDQMKVEKVKESTMKIKEYVLQSLIDFGKIKKFKDLTPDLIMEYDDYLRNDSDRTDYTIYHNYHKKVHKYVRMLKMRGMIPSDPYEQVSIPVGSNKERRPLTEDELLKIRKTKLNDKLGKARDIFVFMAYTGLSYCDAQSFNYDEVTEKDEDGNVYIDGSRLKTGSIFFTPILKPAMQILKKYDYQIPKISNHNFNDYLHIIEAKLGLNKSLTTHVARHSFATLVLSYDIPIENLARMMGHHEIRTTQIYAKILKKTIERHASDLNNKIK